MDEIEPAKSLDSIHTLQKSAKSRKKESVGKHSEQVSQSAMNGDSLRSYLQGAWFEPGEENAFFGIYGDTIRYLENFTRPFQFEVASGKLVFYYDNGEEYIQKIIKAKNDSLILDEEGKHILYLRGK